MPNSVGGAYAILKGRRMGNPDEAAGFLESMSPGERTTRNRGEQRERTTRRKKARLMGSRVHKRKTY